jgi:hypothetical protein
MRALFLSFALITALPLAAEDAEKPAEGEKLPEVAPRPETAPSITEVKDEATEGADAAHADGALTGAKVQEGPRIYVVDPALVNLPENLAKTISAAVAQTIEEQGLAAMSRDDAREILEQQAELQMLGADADPLSLSSLGKAVGAKHLLAVVASQVDGDTVFQGRLLDASNVKVLVRREAKASDHDDEVLTAIKELTKLCLAPLFAHLKGSVSLTVSEEGANVFLDGVQLGVTPIDTFEVPGGYHTVAVTKDGFIRWQKGVNPDSKAIAMRVDLRPSVEFMEKWRAEGELYRTVGLVSAGAAVALVAAGAGFGAGMYFALQDRDEKTTRLADDTCAADAISFDNCLNVGLAEDAQEISARQQEIDEASALFTNMSVGAIAAGAVALAASVGATYFFVFGKDPNRYSAFEANAE